MALELVCASRRALGSRLFRRARLRLRHRGPRDFRDVPQREKCGDESDAQKHVFAGMPRTLRTYPNRANWFTTLATFGAGMRKNPATSAIVVRSESDARYINVRSA